MKIKTSELKGAALDWAVATAHYTDGRTIFIMGGIVLVHTAPQSGIHFRFDPSTDWAQGGPIIAREGIYLRAVRKEGHKLNGNWLAMKADGNTGTMVEWVKREDWHNHYFTGSTPLIAAMRCFVASKLGDEVDIPEELCK